MKKTLLIISGIVLILIVGGVWAYLIMFGSPNTVNQIFSKFTIGGNTEQTTGVTGQKTTVDTSPVTNSGTVQRLRQLTTRPVAGAVFTDDSIRYVEKGTGHIYDIDLKTGNETMISGTTMAQTVDAVFSENGGRVAIITERDGTHSVIVGTISKDDNGDGTLDGITLPDSAREISFTDSGESIRYLITTEGGSEGHSYNIAEQKDSLLFSIPLRDVRVLWGKDTYIYTTPSAKQVGYIYSVNGNKLDYVEPGASGLMGILYKEGYIVSSTGENGLDSTAYEGGTSIDLPNGLFPEKCVDNPAATSSVYCTDPLTLPSGTYPDDWYKGVVSLKDILWDVNTHSGEAELMSDFSSESGRDIDVAKIGTNSDGSYIWFINKNDDTLWMYDTTL